MKHLLAFLLILALPLCSACGKKGLPVPPGTPDTVTISGAKATMDTRLIKGRPVRCLTILTDLTGSINSLDEFMLELEPLTDETCLGCPFLPSETGIPTSTDIIHASNLTRYTLEYCPKEQASDYRWRLTAKHKEADTPNTLGKIYGTANEHQ